MADHHNPVAVAQRVDGESAVFVCSMCGHPTREPSSLLGRAWCVECGDYVIPLAVS